MTDLSPFHFSRYRQVYQIALSPPNVMRPLPSIAMVRRPSRRTAVHGLVAKHIRSLATGREVQDRFVALQKPWCFRRR